MYKKIGLTVIFLLLGPYEAPAKPGINPITSYNRIWLEWNLTPNVKWAPSSVDPEAIHDRTLNVLKLQPVFSARLSKDWTILTAQFFIRFSAFGVTVFGPSLSENPSFRIGTNGIEQICRMSTRRPSLCPTRP